MKPILLLLSLTAVLATPVIAQDAPPPGRERPAGPSMPLIEALDANHDHVISADEIANAVAALKSLDKNEDGALTGDEIHPQRPEGEGPPADRRAGGEPPAPRHEPAAEGQPEHPPAGRSPHPVGTEARPAGEPGERGGEGRGERPPHQIPPVTAALDLNKDGSLDAGEIAKAVESLKTLDKNGDGQLTEDEFAPQRPRGDRPQGGGRAGREGNREGGAGRAPGGARPGLEE